MEQTKPAPWTDKQRTEARDRLRSLVLHMLRATARGALRHPDGIPCLRVETVCADGSGTGTARVMAAPMLEDLAAVLGYASFEDAKVSAVSPQCSMEAIMAGATPDPMMFDEVGLLRQLGAGLDGSVRAQAMNELLKCDTRIAEILAKANVMMPASALALALYHLLNAAAAIAEAKYTGDDFMRIATFVRGLMMMESAPVSVDESDEGGE